MISSYQWRLPFPSIWQISWRADCFSQLRNRVVLGLHSSLVKYVPPLVCPESPSFLTELSNHTKQVKIWQISWGEDWSCVLQASASDGSLFLKHLKDCRIFHSAFLPKLPSFWTTLELSKWLMRKISLVFWVLSISNPLTKSSAGFSLHTESFCLSQADISPHPAGDYQLIQDEPFLLWNFGLYSPCCSHGFPLSLKYKYFKFI